MKQITITLTEQQLDNIITVMESVQSLTAQILLNDDSLEMHHETKIVDRLANKLGVYFQDFYDEMDGGS